MIEAVLDVLQPAISQTTRTQLQTRFFVDRVNERIHTLHFDRREDHLTITDAGFDDALFKVSMRVNGKRQTGRVTFYEGYIFSVETPKPEKLYRDADIEILKIERASPKASLTYVVDRLEHGRPEEEKL